MLLAKLLLLTILLLPACEFATPCAGDGEGYYLARNGSCVRHTDPSDLPPDEEKKEDTPVTEPSPPPTPAPSPRRAPRAAPPAVPTRKSKRKRRVPYCKHRPNRPCRKKRMALKKKLKREGLYIPSPPLRRKGK